MMALLRIALRNIWFNWRHSTAALISIAIAFISLVVFQGYMDHLEKVYFDYYRHRALYGDAIIENKNLYSKQGRLNPFQFQLDEQDQIFVNEFLEKRADLIQAKVRTLQVQGTVTNGHSSNIFLGLGYDLQQGLRMRGPVWAWNTLAGTPLEMTAAKDSMLFGQGLGRFMGCVKEKEGNITLPSGGYPPESRPFHCARGDMQLLASSEKGRMNALDLQVVGLMDGSYRELDDRLIQMSLENAQTLLHTKKITAESVLLKDLSKREEIIKDFRETARQHFPHLEIIPWQEHRAGEIYVKTMSVLSIFRNFVVVVVGLISALTVMNSTIRTVTERTREIGTLLSIGFNRRRVLMLFLTESVFLSLIGCFIGAILAFAISSLVNALHIFIRGVNFAQPVPLIIDFEAIRYADAGILLVLLNFVVVLFVCRRILVRKIVDCLTHA